MITQGYLNTIMNITTKFQDDFGQPGLPIRQQQPSGDIQRQKVLEKIYIFLTGKQAKIIICSY